MTTTVGEDSTDSTDAQIRILLTVTFITILAQMSLSPVGLWCKRVARVPGKSGAHCG
jgi:hypothetical protein